MYYYSKILLKNIKNIKDMILTNFFKLNVFYMNYSNF
jgi:hypothetical protein